MVYKDRRDAGRRLAAELAQFAAERPIILALPRGGVPVAAEVASSLGAPLDVLTVRKLGSSLNPELAVGAIAEDGTTVVDGELARETGMSQAEFDRTLERERLELRRRLERFRGGRPMPDVHDRTVIVIDDGLATGLTALAAVLALRRQGAARIVMAVPVSSREAMALLSEEVDEAICLVTPRDFGGVGRWYDDFSPVSDEHVLESLASVGESTPPVDGDASDVQFAIEGARLRGNLTVPAGARGLVIFAHGSGSSRLSPRNTRVARALNASGFATLLFDLLSEDEGLRRELVFDIALLSSRLEQVTRRMAEDAPTRGLPIGIFGASTGAAAALRVAAELGDAIRAVVSRGGRPDLAADRLERVRAPTLLIVGSRDEEVLRLNRDAAARLHCPKRIALVEGARHLFEEPGALDEVTRLAIEWFADHLMAPAPAAAQA